MEIEFGNIVWELELDSAEERALAITGFVILLLIVATIANRIRMSAPLLLILVGIGISFVYADILPLPPAMVIVGTITPLL